MTIVEQLARYIAARLGLPFEGGNASGAVFFGSMPDAPAKAICVSAGDLRDAGDPGGTLAQVDIRSDLDGAWPLRQAARLMRLLDGQRDVIFMPEGYYVHRIEAERGFEYAGAGQNNTQYHTARFRIYYCE